MKLPIPLPEKDDLKAAWRHLWRRKNLFTLGCFWIGGTAIILSAIGGTSGSRLFLAIWAASLTMALALLLALYSGLLDETLGHCRELLDLWKTDSDYAHDVTEDYVRLLGDLYDHDPEKAELYRERLADHALKRHPDLAVWIDEQIARAGWN